MNLEDFVSSGHPQNAPEYISIYQIQNVVASLSLRLVEVHSHVAL